MAARVLHLLSQRPGWTGSGVALDAIVRAANDHGWEQRAVVGTAADDPTPSVGDLAADQVHPLVFERNGLPFPVPGMSDVMPYRSSRFSDLTGEQLEAYRAAWRRRVRDTVEAFQPDVIHSHHLWLLSAMLKDLAPRTPIVTHCHGTGLRQLALCPHLADQVRTGVARNDAFLVLHRGHAEALEHQFGIDTERVHVIGSGFNAQAFHSRGRAADCGPIVTYAGKLSASKGVPWLLDAVADLSGRIPGFTLHVAGSGAGAEADAIRERIRSSDNVVFHGQLDQGRLADLLRRSAVFVLPSFYEGLPLVLVEAAACGCRLVATELPGVVDQLRPLLGDCLQLVPLPRLKNTDCPVAEDLPQFVRQLADGMEISLSQPHLTDVGERVAGMTWEAVFERIQTVWRHVIRDAG